MRLAVLAVLFALLVSPLAAQSGAPFLVEAAFDAVWAYPGQGVLYTVTAYSDTARDVSFTMPTFEGFWQSGARAFTGGSATIDGKQYSVSVYQVSLYPQRTGLLTVPPARVNFAETVFSAGATRTSNEAVLDVLPLPPAPDGFSGLVGAVGVHFSAEPAVVGLGEPVDMTLRLQGAANLAQYDTPAPIMPDGWRLYTAPRSTDAEFDGNVLTQARIVRWRAVPDRAGHATLALPPLVIFTLANGYETIDIAPIDIEVLPGPNGERSREALTATVASLLVPPSPQTAADDVPFALWLAAPGAALLAVAGRAGLRRWRILRAEARKQNAFKTAAARLRAANRTDGDLGAIEAAIHGYFADRQRDSAAYEEIDALLVEVESQRYNPDGARHAQALARRAAEVLKRIEGEQL